MLEGRIKVLFANDGFMGGSLSGRKGEQLW